MWFVISILAVGLLLVKLHQAREKGGDLLCAFNCHDWRNGPGTRCVLCEEPDELWVKE